MTKQNSSPKTTVAAGETDASAREKSLFVKVDTLDKTGKLVGTRIVDMYHFGTRNWLQNHTWWAMHNGHVITTVVATEAEVEAHKAAQIQALADKFNGERTYAAA